MIKLCFPCSLQEAGTSLELVLQLWLTLNADASVDRSSNNSTQFDHSLCPVIPLSSTAISCLISTLSWYVNFLKVIYLKI